MATHLSPGVLVKEVDLSTSVAAVDSTATGTVGIFDWGPAMQLVPISSEDKILKTFGRPNPSYSQYWMCAASFLAYASSLYIVRAISDTVLNAVSGTGAPDEVITGLQISNDDVWEEMYKFGDGAVGPFAARYPGAYGNGIRISIADSATFDAWEFRDLFDGAPGTSDYAMARGATNDEMHIVVIDKVGRFTGVPGAILDTYAFVSKGQDAKYLDGGPAYYKTVISQNSSYIHWMDHLAGVTGIGSNVAGVTFGSLSEVYDVTLSGGSDGTDSIGDAELMAAWDMYSNAENIDISLAFPGPVSKAVYQYIIDNIAEVRKDFLLTVSPQLADVRGADIATKVVAGKNDQTNGLNRSTSYATYDCNWKLMFDRYNETNVWIPLNADIAGLCAQTDSTRDAWFSPAGYERGNLKNVVKLAWNPDKSDRDLLYKNGINPVLNMKGQGPMLYGDKTMLNRTSAFDRINVRRLFLVLEKAIAQSSKYSLFEFNDEFSRAQFRNMVEPFLRDVKGRRGIYDFLVVCDETNNTPEVIDRNEFVGSIFVKPSRSISGITLSFVATRTGVEFSEVVGAV